MRVRLARYLATLQSGGRVFHYNEFQMLTPDELRDLTDDGDAAVASLQSLAAALERLQADIACGGMDFLRANSAARDIALSYVVMWCRALEARAELARDITERDSLRN